MPTEYASGEYFATNAISRTRLQNIVSMLTEESHRCIAKYGWTISMTLAHMAFWDNYRLSQLALWEHSGFEKQMGDLEEVNTALRPLIQVIDGANAGRIAIAATEALDKKIEMIDSRLVDDIVRGGSQRVLDRARHRNEHMDEIEQALGTDTRRASR